MDSYKGVRWVRIVFAAVAISAATYAIIGSDIHSRIMPNDLQRVEVAAPIVESRYVSLGDSSQPEDYITARDGGLVTGGTGSGTSIVYRSQAHLRVEGEQLMREDSNVPTVVSKASPICDAYTLCPTRDQQGKTIKRPMACIFPCDQLVSATGSMQPKIITRHAAIFEENDSSDVYSATGSEIVVTRPALRPFDAVN